VRIIVLDCFSRMGLAVINALDRSYELVGGEGEPAAGGLPRRDRYLKSPRLREVFRYPGVGRDEAGFREAILDACQRHRADAVFPTSSATAIALSRLKQDLGDDPPATFICEEYGRLSNLSDKWGLYEVALELGIPAPRTVLSSEERFDEALALGLPLVAKPRLAEAAQGLRFVRTSAELTEIVRTPPHAAGAHPDGGGSSYILQEFIAGEVHNVGGCVQDGICISLLTNKHLLERFEHGGPGIVHITTHVPEVMEYASMLAAHTSWNGPLHFNFILDERGRYLLTDCNPRVWGSTELAVAAGVNVCQQAVDVMVLGRRLPVQEGYRVGLVSKWITPGSVMRCFDKPRTLGAVGSRLGALVDPRHPSVTNLRFGNFRHLAAIVLDTSGRRRRTRTQVAPQPAGTDASPKSSATSP
jgi:biotin carboxylase